jgi:cytosine/adenosine deaminase-related metal-dependent hydrolase
VFAAAHPDWDGASRGAAGLRAPDGVRHGPDLTHAYGARNPEGAGADDVVGEWESARAAGLRIHAHVGTDPAAAGTVARLGGAGLLGDDVTLVHCTALDEHDLDAVVSSQAKVSLTPTMEMTNGVGSPPLQAFIDRGIRPGLGVGSEMEAPGDLFAQMRAANSVQHATLFDLKLAGKGGVPNLLSTRDVIRYATIDGAAAAGLAAVTGSLSPGKKADVIVLRTDRPNIAPVNDPIGAVVWGMDTSNIDWVFVSGRALVRNGELTADVSRARDLAVAARQAVAASAGLLADGAEQG